MCSETFPSMGQLRLHTKAHQVEETVINLPIQQHEGNVIVNQSTNIETVYLAADDKLIATPIGKEAGEQMSVHVLVNDSALVGSEYDNYHSLLISAALNADMALESQSNSRQTYQVMCVNPHTQEVVGEGQEVIVQGQTFENELMVCRNEISGTVLPQK